MLGRTAGVGSVSHEHIRSRVSRHWTPTLTLILALALALALVLAL